MELSLATEAVSFQNLPRAGSHAGLPDQSRNRVVDTT